MAAWDARIRQQRVSGTLPEEERRRYRVSNADVWKEGRGRTGGLVLDYVLPIDRLGTRWSGVPTRIHRG